MGDVTGTYYPVADRAITGSTLQCQKGRGAEGLKLTSSTSADIVQDKDGADWTAPGPGVVELECDELAWAKVGAEGVEAAPNDAIRLPAATTKWFSVQAGDQISVKDAA